MNRSEVFRFWRSASAKNETQKEDKEPRRKITSGLPRNGSQQKILPKKLIAEMHLSINYEYSTQGICSSEWISFWRG